AAKEQEVFEERQSQRRRAEQQTCAGNQRLIRQPAAQGRQNARAHQGAGSEATEQNSVTGGAVTQFILRAQRQQRPQRGGAQNESAGPDQYRLQRGRVTHVTQTGANG